MSNTTLRQAFGDIADAIRAKGITGTMTPLEMPSKIADIPSGGGTKYGLSMDNILGDVDANGALQAPVAGDFISTEIRSVPDYAFNYRFYRSGILRTISLPNLTTAGEYSWQYGCRYASTLESVNFSGLKNLGVRNAFHYAFAGCPKLKTAIFSGIEMTSGTTQSFTSTFNGCPLLEVVDFSSLTSVGGMQDLNSFCGSCTGLKRVYLTKLSNAPGLNATGSMFYGCTSLEFVDFSQATAVPALANTAAFQNTNNTFKIVVPDALYDTWVAASNWSTFASHIVKASEYVVPPPPSAA